MVEQLLTGELFGTYASEKCGICGGISNPIPYHTIPYRPMVWDREVRYHTSLKGVGSWHFLGYPIYIPQHYLIRTIPHQPMMVWFLEGLLPHHSTPFRCPTLGPVEKMAYIQESRDERPGSNYVQNATLGSCMCIYQLKTSHR